MGYAWGKFNISHATKGPVDYENSKLIDMHSKEESFNFVKIGGDWDRWREEVIFRKGFPENEANNKKIKYMMDA